ncbi:MAG: thioredoxin family protein [Chitinophagales bacterium]
MKHLTCFFIGYLLFTINVFSHAKGINFEDTSWATILKTAKTENKYIFIDAYAEYCLPCKVMEKETFSQSIIGDFFNQNFVSYKMDIEAIKNDYLVQIYKIRELPALLFLSPEGELIQKIIGKQDISPLLELGNKVIDKTGNVPVVKEDDSLIPLEQLLGDIDSYKIRHGGHKINWMVKQQTYKEVLQTAYKKDVFSFQKIISAMSKANLPDRDRFTFNMQTLFYQMIEDWNSYFEVTSNYLSIKKNTKPKQLNEIAWNYYLHIEDPQQLKQAIQWIEKSIKIESEYYNNYTYTSLLYKTGEIKKANKVAKKASYMASARGIDDSDLIHLVEKNTK